MNANAMAASSAPLTEDSISLEMIENSNTIYPHSQNNTEIQVTIHIPNTVLESIQQRKINAIYDILNPKKMNSE